MQSCTDLVFGYFRYLPHTHYCNFTDQIWAERKPTVHVVRIWYDDLLTYVFSSSGGWVIGERVVSTLHSIVSRSQTLYLTAIYARS